MANNHYPFLSSTIPKPTCKRGPHLCTTEPIRLSFSMASLLHYLHISPFRLPLPRTPSKSFPPSEALQSTASAPKHYTLVNKAQSHPACRLSDDYTFAEPVSSIHEPLLPSATSLAPPVFEEPWLDTTGFRRSLCLNGTPLLKTPWTLM